MYFVYILECADGSLYTGITTDVERRVKEHISGRGGHYTATHKPKEILFVEQHFSRSSALKREAAIKRFTRTQKLELARVVKGTP